MDADTKTMQTLEAAYVILLVDLSRYDPNPDGSSQPKDRRAFCIFIHGLLKWQYIVIADTKNLQRMNKEIDDAILLFCCLMVIRLSGKMLILICIIDDAQVLRLLGLGPLLMAVT